MDKEVILLALLDQHIGALGTPSKTERNFSSSMLLSVSLVALPKRISPAPLCRSPHKEVLRIHHHLPVISVRLIEFLLLLHKLCPITIRLSTLQSYTNIPERDKNLGLCLT